MIKACIFDLDGVIVDTAKYHFIAWSELAKELDIAFTLSDNERLKGVSRMQSLEILLDIGGKKLTAREKEMLAERKNSLYVSFIRKMTPDDILPGIGAFLSELRKNGIKTAIGSASKNTPTILDQIQLSELFDVIVDGNSVAEAKPNPEVFLKAAERLGILPRNCVVFEDAVAGIEAARNAGMACIGIGDKEILFRAGYTMEGFDGFTLETLKQVTLSGENNTI